MILERQRGVSDMSNKSHSRGYPGNVVFLKNSHCCPRVAESSDMRLPCGSNSEKSITHTEDVSRVSSSTTLPRITVRTAPGDRGKDFGMGNPWTRIRQAVRHRHRVRAVQLAAYERDAVAEFTHDLRRALVEMGPPPGFSERA